MTRIIVTFGLIAGGLIAVFMLASIQLYVKDGTADFQHSEWLGYLSMIIALSMVFLGVRRYRDQELGGFISFSKAFQVGLMITLIASAIYVAAWMLYVSFGPGQDFMDQYYAYSVQKLQESGEAKEVIEQEIARMDQFKEAYRSPLVQIGVTFLEIFPVGLIITLISAWLLRRRRLQETA